MLDYLEAAQHGDAHGLAATGLATDARPGAAALATSSFTATFAGRHRPTTVATAIATSLSATAGSANLIPTTFAAAAAAVAIAIATTATPASSSSTPSMLAAARCTLVYVWVRACVWCELTGMSAGPCPHACVVPRTYCVIPSFYTGTRGTCVFIFCTAHGVPGPAAAHRRASSSQLAPRARGLRETEGYGSPKAGIRCFVIRHDKARRLAHGRTVVRAWRHRAPGPATARRAHARGRLREIEGACEMVDRILAFDVSSSLATELAASRNSVGRRHSRARHAAAHARGRLGEIA